MTANRVLGLFGMVYWLGIISDVAAKYNFNCGRENKEITAYTKGDLVYICFHFMPYSVKIGFPIKIDEYTGLEVPDSFTLFETKTPAMTSIHSQLDVYQDYSEPSVYLVKSSKLVVNVMHLVIRLNEGKLQSFRWIRDCYGCNKTDICKEMATSYENNNNKTESIKYQTCAQSWPNIDTEKKKANLKVYPI